MSSSVGNNFPTSNINSGHIHLDTGVSPNRSYMYIGGDPTDLTNSWTELDLRTSPDFFLKQNANGKLPSSSVEVNNIGGITTQDILNNHVLSNGLITGGTVSQGTGNTVNVAACKALVRSSDDATATLYFVTCVATVGLSVPLDATRYIHLNYNSGTPVVTADTTYDDENRTKVYLAEVHNVNGMFHIHNDPAFRGDYTHRLTEYIEGIMNNRVASGEAVSETGTRNLIVTAGVIWDRHINKQITPAFDSSGSDTFSAYYRSGTPGAFTLVTGETQWNNTQYDDGSGSLATLTGGNYGVHFVIRGLSGVVAIMYGEGDYASQALAEAAEAPTLRPEEYDEHGIFIAQLVFLKSAATLAKITSIKPIVGSGGTTGGGTSISLPLAVNQGGTGATTAAAARTNLELNNVTNDAQLKRAAGDFATFTEKTALASADQLLIEDSAASNAKKKVSANNLMWADQNTLIYDGALTVNLR